MSKWPDAVEGKITLEWIVKGTCGIFRWHKEPFVRPAPTIGSCVVHVYSPTSYEIKALTADMGKEMIQGYRMLVSIMAREGYTGARIERYDEDGNGTVIVDGKRIEKEMTECQT